MFLVSILPKGGVIVVANKQESNRMIQKLWNIISGVVVFGFILFSMIIGGSAGLGYQENGRYFVRDHGTAVEVSQVVWNVSYIWGVLFLIFLVLVPVGSFIFQRLNKCMK